MMPPFRFIKEGEKMKRRITLISAIAILAVVFCSIFAIGVSAADETPVAESTAPAVGIWAVSIDNPAIGSNIMYAVKSDADLTTGTLSLLVWDSITAGEKYSKGNAQKEITTYDVMNIGGNDYYVFKVEVNIGDYANPVYTRVCYTTDTNVSYYSQMNKYSVTTYAVDAIANGIYSENSAFAEALNDLFKVGEGGTLAPDYHRVDLKSIFGVSDVRFGDGFGFGYYASGTEIESTSVSGLDKYTWIDEEGNEVGTIPTIVVGESTVKYSASLGLDKFNEKYATLASGQTANDVLRVSGTVKSIDEKQFTITDGANDLVAYDGATVLINADVKVGDTVTVSGNPKNYNGLLEIVVATLVSHTEHDCVDEDKDKDGKCDRCGTYTDTAKYVFEDYTAGKQYEENEEHVLDDIVTVTTTQCHFTSELRIYSSSAHDGYAIISSTKVIASIVVNAGNKADTLNVYGSTDGETWTLIAEVTTTSAYADHTVDVPSTLADCKYLKLDVAGTEQVRIKYIELAFKPCSVHAYDNCTDLECNKCGEIRNAEDVLDSEHNWGACTNDTCTNGCGTTRTVEEGTQCVDENPIDEICDTCGTAMPHSTHTDSPDDDDCICDTAGCDVLVSHTYSTYTHKCDVCGEINEDHECSYDDNCDDSCNLCGTTRTPPHTFDPLANKCDDCGLITEHECVDSDNNSKCDDCDAAIAKWTWNKATSIAVGDKIILTGNTSATSRYALNGVASNIGSAILCDDTPNTADSWYVLTVVEGYTSGTVAFVDSEGNYLSYTGSSNQLHTSTTLSASSSWTVTFNEDGNAIITNCGSTTRILQYNYNNGNPRFACYTSSQQKIGIFKMDCGENHTYTTYSHKCDICGYINENHECVSAEDNGLCDLCGEAMAHEHINEDNDCVCDVEGCDEIMHTYTTLSAKCAVCGEVKAEHTTHTNLDENKVCTDCGVCTEHRYESDCTDECLNCAEKRTVIPHKWNGDCDTECDCGVTREKGLCVDADNDGFCDYCNAEYALTTVEKNIAFDDETKRTVSTTEQQVWTENGITLTNDKDSSSTAVNTAINPIKLYANSKVTITCDSGTMTQIVVTCGSTSYATALVNSVNATDSATATANGTTVTITLKTATSSYIFTCTAQVRVKSMVVTVVG